VHGIEDLREEILRKSRISGNNIILEITTLSEIVEKLEKLKQD